ncbi:MAG: hypothetical protein HZA50_15340 [Planctomycetes bacterium]|nr:hypothetical protein [Planctomycetota bacterium]
MTKDEGKVTVTVDITGLGSVSGDIPYKDFNGNFLINPKFGDIKEPVATKPLPAKKGK